MGKVDIGTGIILINNKIILSENLFSPHCVVLEQLCLVFLNTEIFCSQLDVYCRRSGNAFDLEVPKEQNRNGCDNNLSSQSSADDKNRDPLYDTIVEPFTVNVARVCFF